MRINDKRTVHILTIIVVILAASLLATITVLAGNTDSPAAPGSTTGFTLEDIYNAVSSDSAHNAMPQTGFAEPSVAPGTSTMHSLDDIMGVLIGHVPKTGQAICYDATGSEIGCSGTGQDGEKRMGSLPIHVPASGTTGAYTISEWTGTRFTNNGDGTVTDNVTGLIWLQNANCWGTQTWATALTNANGLASGTCGLSDGSTAGDWRLPNLNELHSLIDLTQAGPALPSGHPFSNVQLNWYWSSTTDVNSTSVAWFVNFSSGLVSGTSKPAPFYAWPVRAGE